MLRPKSNANIGNPLAATLSSALANGSRRNGHLLLGVQQLLDALPAAIYLTDAEGRITHYNDACVRLSGRSPEIGNDRWCVTWKLYRPDGTRLPHSECPMAVALRERTAIQNAEIVAEKPDGSRASVMASPAPLLDESGTLIGGVNLLVDITERKEAEESIKRSERELVDFFETASIGLHWVGPDGIIQRVNSAELDLLGYSEDEYIGRHIAEFHVDQAVIEDILARLSRGERLHEYPARLRCKDGSTRDVLINSSVLFEDGEFIHTRCFTTDVTDRKRAEESLRRSAQTLATLVEQSPLGIYTVDSKFRIAHVSEGAMPAFRNVQPVIGRDFADVMHTIWPDPFASEAIRIFRHTLDTGEPYVSPGLTEKRKDIGEIESYEWQLNRIVMPDGEFGVVCYFFDTTRIQQANVALRESEERFRTLADNMSQLAWTCRNLCEMNWVNRRWLEFTGLPVDETVGWGWTRAHHPEHLDRVIEGKRRSQETGEIWEDTFPLRRHDGEYRWFLSRAVPIRDDDGEVIRWFGTNTDITERRELEEHMRTMMAELNHRVKNSLAVISSISRQTTRRARSLHEFATDFDARLRSIAKAHSLLTSTDWKGCSLADVVHNEIDPRIAAPGQATISGPFIMLTPKQGLALHMVIHELATNAMKYGALNSESGRLSIHWDVVGKRGNLCLRFEWQETCCDEVVPPVEEGFGSELVDQSVEYELDGEIRREFTPTGLHCTFQIPLDVRANPSFPADLPADGSSRRNQVLVVEDNTLIATAMVREIEQMGFDVLGPARTLDAALKIAEREQPAVALLDVDLNGIKVYPLARYLRQQGVPHALLTGYSAQDIPPDLRDSPILGKPVDMDDVEDFLCRFVSPRDVASSPGGNGNNRG